MFTDVSALDVFLRGTLLALVGLSWVVICVRIVGLRAFSKMTSFDFVTPLPSVHFSRDVCKPPIGVRWCRR